MKEKILFISSNYPPRIGGPATTVPQVAKALSKEFDISVIAFREKGVPSYEKTEFELFRSPSFYGFGFSNPLSVAIRTLQMSLYARWVLGKRNARIIHAHDTHISAISALFCKYTSFGKKVFVKYAGDLVLEYSGLSESEGTSIEEIFARPTFKQRILLGIQKRIFRMADKLHVQNEYQAQILQKHYNIPRADIVVIPNPIELSFGESGAKKQGQEILMVSRIVPWKGHEIMLRAMPIIIKNKNSCRLTIVGDGEKKYVLKLQKLCRELGIGKNVSFAGKIPHQKLSPYYKKARVFIQPSLYEPFGITVIEALAHGIPVVASDTGGLPEIVKEGKTGFIFRAGNIEELARKTVRAFDFAPTKAEIRKTIGKFSLETIAKEYERCYSG